MSMSLDAIRQAADAKYGSFDIDLPDGTVSKLLNPLRLSEAARTELMNVQSELSSDDASVSQVEVFERAITIVCATEGQAERLLSFVGGDLALLAEIFSNYGNGTQVGEASASAA